MKPALQIALLVLATCTFNKLAAQQVDPLKLKNSYTAFTTSNSSVDLTKSASEGWYNKASQYLREQDMQIKWMPSLEQYVAVNRNNQLGFFFEPDGYRVHSFSTTETKTEDWQFNFRVKAISREQQKLVATSTPKIIHSGKKLMFQYPGYAIEYLNDDKGMRQNFIVTEKIGGQGKLQLAISLEGQLNATVEAMNQLILYTDCDGKRSDKLFYDGLKVWDKNNVALNAQMELADEGKTLLIKVNDINAQYPITIDPLNHTPAWTDNGLGVLPALDVLYGSSVSIAGDVNNDGYDDIIIGAPLSIDILTNSTIASIGKAFIYLGSGSGASATPDITLQSSTTINGLFGFSVSSAGDINQDGFDDVIVGAPADQVTLNFGFPFGSLSNNVGKVYVYYGNATPASIPGSVVTINLGVPDFNPLTFALGLTVNPLYGFSVSSAGDVNNDGYDDVIIGSPAYIDLGTLTLAGRATVYLGSNSGLNTASPIHRNAGLLSSALFGFSVSSAGDMNNDGADEVLIGAPGALSILPGLTGKAYVYPGISIPTTGGIASSPVTYSDGALLKTLFGYSVSKAGDVNNDGFGDIIIGQPATLDLSALVTVGKAVIFYGSASLVNKNTADVTLHSPRDPDILGLLNGNLLFGFSVSGGKDLDCDGISDVVVGEPGGSALAGLLGLNAAGGHSYIFFGQNIAGPSSLWRWELKETGTLVVANLLGSSVNVGGDVNGDGINDVMIGASNGTLDLSSLLSGIINFTFVQSIGSAYVFTGCITPTLYTLPIKLSYFNGYLNKDEVLLKWQTATEQNSSHFEIERSVNGSIFVKIGTVASRGNSNVSVDYNFTDSKPLEGDNAYRLRSVDKDGKFTHSDVINIKLKSANSSVNAWSNAGSRKINIDFKNVKEGNYTISLFSLNGALQQQTQLNVSSGSSMQYVTVANTVSAGVYIIKLQNRNAAEFYHTKLIIR